MKTMRWITLSAAAVLMAACQDGPTLPEMDLPADESAAAALMDQSYALAHAAVDSSVTRLPRDTARTRPRDPIRRPGDPTRPEPHRPERATRAELMVELGAEAVALAERLLAEHGADEQQKRFLEQARDFQRKAVAALGEGQEARAVELAQAASQHALKAVVLPGGVTDEEARMIRDTAEDLLRRARAAVAADPTDAKRHLLAVAEQLFRAGSEQLAAPRGNERGVATLWTAATLAAWLAG